MLLTAELALQPIIVGIKCQLAISQGHIAWVLHWGTVLALTDVRKTHFKCVWHLW